MSYLKNSMSSYTHRVLLFIHQFYYNVLYPAPSPVHILLKDIFWQ